MTALSVGLSLLASTLSKGKKPRFTFDDTPTMLSTRGSFLPLLIGDYRIGYIFAWAGDRFTKKIKTGGGKGFGGGGSSSTYEYYESGWHLLCVGPGDKLNKIRQGEKVIWDTLLSRKAVPEHGIPATPSGSEFECDNGEGTFAIYWGECDQPVNEFLGAADKVGVSSRWPHHMYILWKRKKLGSSPTWPQLDYEIGVRHNNENDSFPGYDTFIETANTPPDPEDRGLPPHAIVWQLITAAFPHGCGVDPTNINDAGFTELAEVGIDEHLPMNFLAQDGEEGASAIARVAVDAGFFLRQVNDKLECKVIRSVEGLDLPTFTDDMLVDLDPDQEKQLGPFAPDRVIFSIADRALSYKPNGLPFRNDGQARSRLRTQVRQEKLTTITDRATGYKVGKRRALEFSVKGNASKMTVTRGARRTYPGDAFRHPTLGLLRCMSWEPQTDAHKTNIEAMVDEYSYGGNSYVPDDLDWEPGGGSLAVTNDLAFRLVVLPVALAPLISVAMLRIRAHAQIVAAEVWIRKIGGSTVYSNAGNQDEAATGGTLNSSMAITGDIAVGPSFTVLGPDIAEVQDLTGDPSAYDAGEQLLIIDDEIMLLESIAAVSGGFQLQGIKRAQFGTLESYHSTGAVAYIVRRASIVPITHSLITGGVTIAARSRPKTATQAANLGGITPIETVIV